MRDCNFGCSDCGLCFSHTLIRKKSAEARDIERRWDCAHYRVRYELPPFSQLPSRERSRYDSIRSKGLSESGPIGQIRTLVKPLMRSTLRNLTRTAVKTWEVKLRRSMFSRAKSLDRKIEGIGGLAASAWSAFRS